MKFKYPGGDAAFASGIWIFLGVFGVYSATQGRLPWYMAVAIGMGFVACLVWFQIRIAGYTLALIHGTLCVLGIIALFVTEVEFRSFTRLVGSGYMAYAMFKWAHIETANNNFGRHPQRNP